MTEPNDSIERGAPEVVEWVDVVDEFDAVVHRVLRRQMRAERLRHRAVFVVVRSSSHEVLIHRRSPEKDLWPGRWDLAVGGVVTSGESYDGAATRELAEEIGVVGKIPVPIGSGGYDDSEVALVGRVYTVTCDGPFTFSDGEVVEAFFVSLDSLFAGRRVECWVPDSLALVLPLLTLGP